jgi:hypothetical protein
MSCVFAYNTADTAGGKSATTDLVGLTLGGASSMHFKRITQNASVPGGSKLWQ